MPIDPPLTAWSLPDPADVEPGDEFVGFGGDVEPGTILAAYRKGLVPLPLPAQVQDDVGDAYPVGWWSPDPRGVIPLDGLRISKSLRRSLREFEIRINTNFAYVLDACADPLRKHGWIDDDYASMYRELHALGWAHSVEAWSTQDGTLAGGLIGIAIGGYFSGDSMFHHKTNASKVALVGLVEAMSRNGYRLLDVQWPTDHLLSLGAVGVPRPVYLEMLGPALQIRCEPLGTVK